MNERIRQLAEQCESFGSWDNKTYSFDKEKFAELIVQECYQHCKDQLMDKKLAEEAGLDYNDGVMDCAIGLKQHFGIKEVKGWICPKCGADRTKEVCPKGDSAALTGDCPMVGTAQ